MTDRRTRGKIDTFKTLIHRKSLEIPNGGNQNPYIKEEQTTQWQKEEFEDTKGRQSESVYRRRTDNTMGKRKSTKGQTKIYKTYT